MSDYAPVVLLGGVFLSPLLAIMFRGSLADNGAILLGAIIVVATFTAAILMGFGACHENWLGEVSCNSSRHNTIILITSAAGIQDVGWLTFALYRKKRGRARRAIFVGAAVLTVVTFAVAILSIGVFLILGALALLGWLAIKNPPLRESELTPAS